MAYGVEQSAIKEDLADIMKPEPGFIPFFLLRTILHTETKDLEVHEGTYISALRITRDYKGGAGDYIEIDLIISRGTWLYDVYPVANNLELTLEITKQHRQAKFKAAYTEVRYKANWLVERNPDVPTTPSGPRDQINREPPFKITLQLIDKTDFAMRSMYTQGVIDDTLSPKNTDMKADSIIKTLVSKAVGEIEVAGKKIIDQLSIQMPNNMDPLKTILIPTGTKLIDVPNFMQKEGGGVYTAGVGTYIQRYSDDKWSKTLNTMFVYSLYDGELYNQTKRKIMFFIPPTGSHNTVNNTYKFESEVLKIMTNPIAGLHSTKDAMLRKEGEGFRTASAEAMAFKPIEQTKDGPKFKKTGLVTEMINKIQEDGLNYVPYKGISGNHFVNTSDVLARKGEYVKLVVDNMDMDYIYPGAPCKLFYEVAEGLIQELYGVIHRAEITFEYPRFDPAEEQVKETHALTTRILLDVYITGPELDQSV